MANRGKSGSGICVIGVIVIVVLGLYLLGSCSNSESSYDRNFKSGIEKYNTGGEMSKEEYNAVKNFNEWKDNNSSKSYSEWED